MQQKINKWLKIKFELTLFQLNTHATNDLYMQLTQFCSYVMYIHTQYTYT